MPSFSVPEICQYEVWQLDEGGEGYGSSFERPYCLVLSPDEMNENIATVIVAPMTRRSHGYPTRAPIRLDEEDWWVALDQPTTLQRESLVRRHSMLTVRDIKKIKSILLEMLIQ